MNLITGSIWIGNYLDAQDAAARSHHGIRFILCLDGCLAQTTAKELAIERLEVVQLVDGAGNPPERFLRAIRMLEELVKSHAPVLVHCHAVQSRSAAVMCKYLMNFTGKSLGEAMKEISSKRQVAITAGLQRSWISNPVGEVEDE